MQENRSFDNYFGTLKGVRGFGDRTPLRLPTGGTVFEQPRPGGGEVLPFSARRAALDAGRPESDIQYLGSLAHGFSDANQARGNGWWNEWVAAKSQSTMAFYDRHDIPLQYELADRFTICDAYFCSVYGSTNPNRNYLWTGTTGYEPDGVNRAVTNAAYDYGHAGYDWTTYPERLEAAGVSWQIYQEWDNFTDNAVEYFRPWKEIGRKVLAKVSGQYATTEQFYDSLWDRTADQRKAALAEFQQGVDALTKAERRLFIRGAYRSEPDTLVGRLASDIEKGTLPQVSWIVPTAALSEHPGSSTPVGSANLVYDLLDAIARDPKTWSKTALFINFDENDGYFDHVPAPVAPKPASGNGDDWFKGSPVGPGPRVPMTVVSPWTVGGFVSSEAFDHTSVIRFLEKWTGVHEPNISAWRRSVFGDLTSAFDFDRAQRQPEVEQPARVPAPIGRWNPVPPKDQSLPEQESGTRRTRRSPYRLSLRAEVTRSAVELRLGNEGGAGATFTAYPGDDSAPRAWTVSAGRSADETVAYGADGYDLQVHGPGWSMWELRGAGVGGEAYLVEHPAPGQVTVVCSNPSPTTRTFLVGESAHSGGHGDRVETVTLKPGTSHTVRLRLPDHGWYDVVVVDRDDPSFLRRMTGRLADGKPGVTDPETGTAPALAAAIGLPASPPNLDTPFAQGNPTDVVVTVRNQGRHRLDDLSVSLLAPTGWTVRRDGGAPTALRAGDSADVRFAVTPAGNATAGRLAVAAHADGDGLLRIADARVRTKVAPAMSVALTGPASSPNGRHGALAGHTGHRDGHRHQRRRHAAHRCGGRAGPPRGLDRDREGRHAHVGSGPLVGLAGLGRRRARRRGPRLRQPQGDRHREAERRRHAGVRVPVRQDRSRHDRSSARGGLRVRRPRARRGGRSEPARTAGLDPDRSRGLDRHQRAGHAAGYAGAAGLEFPVQAVLVPGRAGPPRLQPGPRCGGRGRPRRLGRHRQPVGPGPVRLDPKHSGGGHPLGHVHPPPGLRLPLPSGEPAGGRGHRHLRHRRPGPAPPLQQRDVREHQPGPGPAEPARPALLPRPRGGDLGEGRLPDLQRGQQLVLGDRQRPSGHRPHRRRLTGLRPTASGGATGITPPPRRVR